MKIQIPRQKIAQFCRKWKIKELSLFGSVLQEGFRPDSDIDLLVSFSLEAKYSLFDLVHMQEELEGIFGRKVDLVEKKSIERSKNYFRRKHILDSQKTVYVA